MFDILLFYFCDKQASNLAFSAADGTMTTSQAVGTAKYKAIDGQGIEQVITLSSTAIWLSCCVLAYPLCGERPGIP